MSETVKHTPGPWLTEVNRYGDEIDVYPQRNGPPPVGRWAEICTVKDYDSQEEMEANAHLISAAPDLLKMLKVAQLWLDVDGRYDMQGINAAIAKAEGR